MIMILPRVRQELQLRVILAGVGQCTIVIQRGKFYHFLAVTVVAVVPVAVFPVVVFPVAVFPVAVKLVAVFPVAVTAGK
jgi:hypothetical protein